LEPDRRAQSLLQLVTSDCDPAAFSLPRNCVSRATAPSNHARSGRKSIGLASFFKFCSSSARSPAVPTQLLRFPVVERTRRPHPSNSAYFLRRYFTMLGQVESRPSYAARILRHRNKISGLHPQHGRRTYGSREVAAIKGVQPAGLAEQYYWPGLPSDYLRQQL
jgi:hypothetical protein